jgi:hypothetical protein
MPETKITGEETLVASRIVPRIETYYLVTEDNLRSISAKNIFTDVFSFIASLLWGAYFSVLIAVGASTELPKDTIKLLMTYQEVFLVSAIIFSLIAACFFWITYAAIAKIRKTSLSEEWQGTSSKVAAPANAEKTGPR